MNIGLPVAFYRMEKGQLVTRSAVISELDEKAGFVHLTMFNRPIADMVLSNKPQYETALSVPFGCPTTTPVPCWCEAVINAALAPALRAKPLPSK